MRVTFGGITAVLLLLVVSVPSNGADTVADLLGWVPAQANAALFIDCDAVLRSEVARKGKWGTGTQPTFGIDSLPPNLSRLVVACQVTPGGGMAWEVGVGAQKKAVTEADFIRKNGGSRDTIAGKPVIVTPRNGIVAQLAPNVAAGYLPLNRQEAGRWLRGATGRLAPGFSSYLRQAGATVGKDAPVVLAFDTTDMFDPAVLKAKLAKVPLLKKLGENPEALANLIAEMRGATLTLKLTDKITAELQLDFEKSVEAYKFAAKPLLLEAAERMGVDGEEMKQWKATVDKNVITFGGELTQQTADLFLAPFLRPSASVLGEEDSAAAADPKAQASLAYFQGVDKKIREVRNSKNSTYPKLANTFNAAARQIDDLRILNVDEDLLNWGNAVSTTFRTMGIVAQAAGGQIDLLEANKMMSSVSTPNYYYGSGYGATAGYWGGAGYAYNYAVPSGTTSTGLVSNYGQVANLQTMTEQQEGQYRMNTWKNIEKETVEVRRKMVKKFGIEF